jgi:carotenoid 1,2-hydratase
LPFLPGLTSAAEQGRGVLPGARPSINLAIYRAGRAAWYLLHEFPPAPRDGEPFDDGELRLGHCVWRNDEVVLSIDHPAGGIALRGRVAFTGLSADPADFEGEGPHIWSPRCPCARLEAEFDLGGERVSFAGLGYHDGNHAFSHLKTLGCAAWSWARFVRPEGTRVFYFLWPADDPSCEGRPEVWAFEARSPDAPAAEGTPGVEALRPLPLDDVRVLEWGRNRMGWLRYPRRVRVGELGELRQVHAIDEGPFYLRFWAEFEESGAGGRASSTTRGISEWVVPARVDLGWQRWLVRMRVSHEAAAGARRDSIWMPLFVGPRQGRVKRLVERWRAALAGTGAAGRRGA